MNTHPGCLLFQMLSVLLGPDFDTPAVGAGGGGEELGGVPEDEMVGQWWPRKQEWLVMAMFK